MLRFNFHPFPTLTTDRLILRNIEEHDLDDLYELRNDLDVMRYINKEEQTREVVGEFLRKVRYNNEHNEAINWAISLKDDSRLIGSFAFWRVDKFHHRAEIGYMLSKTHWKKGYLNECMHACLDFAFQVMKLHSIEAVLTRITMLHVIYCKNLVFNKKHTIKRTITLEVNSSIPLYFLYWKNGGNKYEFV